MLFNCFTCGKKISSKHDLCVYCKTDVTLVVSELNRTEQKSTIKERYTGTLLSLLMKSKAR